MYNVDWIIQSRVILFQGIGDQTMETITEAIEKLTSLLDQGIYPVHVISDNQQVGNFPKDIKALKMLMTQHDNSGISLSVGGNKFEKFISTLLTYYSNGSQLIFKDSINDALAYLYKVDASLPHDLLNSDQP